MHVDRFGCLLNDGNEARHMRIEKRPVDDMHGLEIRDMKILQLMRRNWRGGAIERKAITEEDLEIDDSGDPVPQKPRRIAATGALAAP